jgi:hypothetical protein
MKLVNGKFSPICPRNRNNALYCHQHLLQRTYAMRTTASSQHSPWKYRSIRSHEPLTSVAFSSELITLVTGSTDPASYWSRGGTTATGSLMEHVALVARRYWTAGVRQAMGLDEGLSTRQHMSILMIL